MHSRRIRTVRSSSRLLEGVSALGLSAPEGVCSGGCLILGGGIPACTEADTPPPDRQKDVKT